MSTGQENSTLRPMECGLYTSHGYWWLIVRNPATDATELVQLMSANKAERLRTLGIPQVGEP